MIRSIIPLFFVIAGMGCTSSAQEEGAEPGSWVREHARPIALEGESFEDLAFLEPLLADKRIVQLGENTHGVREYNLVKDRLVRYLHQELGFTVLAFESALYQCFDANETAAGAPAQTTLLNCTYGPWHTTGVLPLFEYLKQSQDADRPLQLAGFDVQPIGPNKAGRPRFLAEAVEGLDVKYARDIFVQDSTFLAVYASGSSERRAFFRSAAGQRMSQAYDRFSAFLRQAVESRVLQISPQERARMRVAAQTASSMAWYIRQQSAPSMLGYVEYRDQGMAENLRFLAEELYPGQKIIVWGHNFHLRHNNLDIPADTSAYPGVAAQTMGTWTRDWYGEALYTIGLYAYEGMSADNSGVPFAIPPADPGSLEARLLEADTRVAFLDLTRSGPFPAWLDEPVTARFNGTYPWPMRLADQYDAILLVDRASPREMLF